MEAGWFLVFWKDDKQSNLTFFLNNGQKEIKSKFKSQN